MNDKRIEGLFPKLDEELKKKQKELEEIAKKLKIISSNAKLEWK